MPGTCRAMRRLGRPAPTIANVGHTIEYHGSNIPGRLGYSCGVTGSSWSTPRRWTTWSARLLDTRRRLSQYSCGSVDCHVRATCGERHPLSTSTSAFVAPALGATGLSVKYPRLMEAEGSLCRCVNKTRRPGRLFTVTTLGFLILVLVCVSQAFGYQLPSRQDCPDCIFGQWQCDEDCFPTGVPLRNFSFEFSYAIGPCWEEIPSTSQAMHLDIDLWCNTPSVQSWLTCETMVNFDFQGLSFLDGCHPKSPAAGDLLKESCSWVCKGNRPFARCAWTFDSGGSFGISGGSLERCWLVKSCLPQDAVVTGVDRYQTEVHVACEPIQLWRKAENLSAEVESVQNDIARVSESYQEAQLIFHDALLAKNRTSANMSRVVVAYFKASQTLNDVLANPGSSSGEVAAAISAHQTSSVELARILATRGRSDEELDHALERHNKTSAELASAYEQLELANLKLKAEEANRKRGLEVNREEHKASIDDLLLLFEKREQRFATLREEHEDLKKESDMHEQKVEDRDALIEILAAAIIVLSLLVCILFVVAMWLFLMRRRSRVAKQPCNLGTTAPPNLSTEAEVDSCFVVGRPVGGSEPGAPSSTDPVEKQGVAGAPLSQAAQPPPLT
eukprot:TRINITY_DN30436_c0_g1_i1.p1 TRINITY_DN30436_c0_g1~~TRINITY_DN30436_c0_g1_i1.p1  ORF type:complete len:650 (+),score=88.87 TRINITY_DN30436_c0_g1_i1:99-1952(+)